MMQSAAQAYSKVATQTCSQRELEADLLLRAASQLQAVAKNWDGRTSDDLHNALRYNRRLWVILVSAVTSSDNPLPVQVRQNVANLGLFVFNETVELTAQPDLVKLESLIDINRQIAAGLLSQP
jgi:flagellar biosynthesis activator protein FlaF